MARTFSPRSSRDFVTLGPIAPTWPAAPVTRMGWECFMSRFLRETQTGAHAGDENGVTEQLHWRLLELVLNWLTGLFEADHLVARLGATHDATMSA
jgi:hypothetical protein